MKTFKFLGITTLAFIAVIAHAGPTNIVITAVSPTNVVVTIPAADWNNIQRSFTNAVASGYSFDILTMVNQDYTNFSLATYTVFWANIDAQITLISPLQKKYQEIIAAGASGSNDLFTLKAILSKYP